MLKQKRFLSLVALMMTAIVFLASCSPAAASTSTTTTGVGKVTQITVVTTINASGTIEPLRLASVAWKTSGTVAGLNVKVGQVVSTNDILMGLDPNTAPDSLITAMQNLAEMTSPASIATAQQAVLTAEDTLTSAKASQYYLNQGYSQGVKDDAYAKMVLAEVTLNKAKDNYKLVADLSVGNENRARAYTALYAAQTAYDSAKRLFVIYDSTATTNDVASVDANVALAQAQLDEAKNYLVALTGEDVPANATGSSLQQLNQAKRTVDEVNLRAPFNGTVGALYNQPGDVVSTNSVSSVIMDRSKLFVTVQVEESKVVQLALGDKATIIVEALPTLKLTGSVIAIDPVGVANQGVVYYSVKVLLDQAELKIPLYATVDVTITAGDAKQALAVPVSAVQSDSVGEFVYVYAKDGSTSRIDVVSGLIQADDTVVVTGNLKVGDQVMLVQSTSTTSSDNGVRGGGGIFGP
jgi:multidrug efflux pump subunit AcrA (membrane-fusion protein)